MLSRWFGIGFALAVAGCGADAEEPADAAQLTPKVLVIGVDGARPDSLIAAETPNLDGVAARGALTTQASTQLTGPTLSGPGWASVLYGVEAAKHQLFGNADYEQRDLSYKSFAWQAKQAHGQAIDVSTGWIHILTLLEDDATEHEYWGGDELVSQDMATQLGTSDAELFFIHFDGVDHAGHATGFAEDNPEYVSAMHDVDTRVGALLESIAGRATRQSENWLIIATTDHGGDGENGHGAEIEACQRIWLLLARDDGALLALDGASQMDVFPSVLTHLGVALEPEWQLDGASRVAALPAPR